MQWNWFFDVTECTWVVCIKWPQRTDFTAPGFRTSVYRNGIGHLHNDVMWYVRAPFPNIPWSNSSVNIQVCLLGGSLKFNRRSTGLFISWPVSYSIESASWCRCSHFWLCPTARTAVPGEKKWSKMKKLWWGQREKCTRVYFAQISFKNLSRKAVPGEVRAETVIKDFSKRFCESWSWVDHALPTADLDLAKCCYSVRVLG